MRRLHRTGLDFLILAALLVATLPVAAIANQVSDNQTVGEGVLPVIFATFAESNEQLGHVALLAESLREFGGAYAEATCWVFVPGTFSDADPELIERLKSLRVELHASHSPESARTYYFSGKVFAAALAETKATNVSAVLVWMDEDTVILREPVAFDLVDDLAFAYRPVMHNRSGTLYAEPPNKFWSRIYAVLKVGDDRLFPMVTPADQETIRAYFNAGLLVVRPERGIFKTWADDFVALYSDSLLARMCREDTEKRIFLHQTALVGAVLNRVSRNQMVELPAEYNYPLFFHQQYKAAHTFGSIDGIVTLRYDTYFRNPDPQWRKQLTGPPDRVAWLTRRLGANEQIR